MPYAITALEKGSEMHGDISRNMHHLRGGRSYAVAVVRLSAINGSLARFSMKQTISSNSRLFSLLITKTLDLHNTAAYIDAPEHERIENSLHYATQSRDHVEYQSIEDLGRRGAPLSAKGRHRVPSWSRDPPRPDDAQVWRQVQAAEERALQTG